MIVKEFPARAAWRQIRPYVRERINLGIESERPTPPAAAVALFTAPFGDSGDAPCAACGQDTMWRTRRKVSVSATDHAFLMLCDDVRACNAATAVVA